MLDEKGYSDFFLNHEGVKNSDVSKRLGTISDRCMKGTDYAVLSGSKFYDRFHDVCSIIPRLVSWQIRFFS